MLVVQQQHALAGLRVHQAHTAGEAGVPVDEHAPGVTRHKLLIRQRRQRGEFLGPESCDLKTHETPSCKSGAGEQGYRARWAGISDSCSAATRPGAARILAAAS